MQERNYPVPHSEKTFKYFIARKNSFLVVSFVGAILDSVRANLELCKAEIVGHSDIRALVLHFGEVTEVGLDAIPVLAQIQHAARTRNVQLRISGLSPELLEKLHKKGILRRPELVSDLKEALVHVARLSAQTPVEAEKKTA